jgi:hypothetical protein
LKPAREGVKPGSNRLGAQPGMGICSGNMVKTETPDTEHAHRAPLLCSRAIESFRATAGLVSTWPRNRFTITMHPADTRSLEMIVGTRVPGHPLIFAGMIVVEDDRFEVSVVSLATDEHQ